jgi:glycosyltransferase involved in cell wall biosynthesis
LYLSRAFGLRECYTDPHVVYRLAKARGMTHVTLTDHDTIEGCRLLAGYPDFIPGEEVTAFFPSDAARVHVLVWGLDEEQHREIQDVRFNVVELSSYLHAAGLPHALSHPTSLVGGEMRPEQFELLLLLFELWETRNGSSTRQENELAAELVARSAELIPRLADKHGIEPAATVVRGVAGSDDRGGLDIGTTYTQITHLRDGDDPLASLTHRKAMLRGSQASTAKTAHTVVSLLLRGGTGDDRRWPTRALLRRGMRSSLFWTMLERRSTAQLAGRVLGLATSPRWRRGGPTARRTAYAEAAHALRTGDLVTGGLQHDRLEAIFESAWERAMRDTLAQMEKVGLSAAIQRGDLWKALAETQTLVAPYLFGATAVSRQRAHARGLRRRLGDAELVEGVPAEGELRVAMFTDTFAEINGVAAVLQPLATYAAGSDWPLTVVSCGAARASEPGHETFAALARFGFDVYEEFPMYIPPLLQMLRWCENERIEAIHAATPGPVGMVAALLARVLGLPLVGSYHTDVPRLGYFLTSDHIVLEGLWTFVRGFYSLCEIVFCPSHAVQDDLAAHGVRSRFAILDQAVDERHFSPAHRSEEVHRVLGGGKKVVLWVGRISPEKGLDFLAMVHNRLRSLRDDVQLVVVGDGPYRDELVRLAPTASFLGYRTGDELATIYASADVFVFPGRAETFGQVVLEAAASGLPAVVTAGTGIDENVVRDTTALVVAPGDANGFVAALQRLLDDDDLRCRFGEAGRARALERSWPATFESVRREYATLQP